MSKKESAPKRSLTKGELRIMQQLWRLKSATVAELVELVGKPKLAYTTVLTVLKVLEEKGFVCRDASQKAHVYAAAIPKSQAENAAITDLVQAFFANSRSALALRLLSRTKLSAEEVRQIRDLIREVHDNEP